MCSYNSYQTEYTCLGLIFLDMFGTVPHTCIHYSGVIMSPMASQIIGISIVWSTVCSGEDQRKHQGSLSLAFVRGTIGNRWFPSQTASDAENVSIDDIITHQAAVVPMKRPGCHLWINHSRGSSDNYYSTQKETKLKHHRINILWDILYLASPIFLANETHSSVIKKLYRYESGFKTCYIPHVVLNHVF